jgi:tetratricopeptide (TPR) repeat protein
MMNSESTLSDALSEVDTALAASDNERAAGLASELLLAYPNAVAVLRHRARALAASGRALQAAEVHRRVLEILPSDGEAMAGLARTLHTAGQPTEAREAARQSLDYLPGDGALKQIASDGQPFEPDQVSLHFFKARADMMTGMTRRSIDRLRTVVAQWPDRADARVALMQALWRDGSRIGAAEQAQAILDDYPNCLNAHLLLLEIWRTAGASDMELVHQRAIEQVDPDHRVSHALMGTQSPLQVKDVPARPAPVDEPAPLDEDPLAREDWVENLVAASLALPKPLDQLREQADMPAADAVEADVDTESPASEASDDEADFLSTFSPLEWSTANDLSEEPAQDEFSVPWIDGDVKDAFSPARPRNAVPDPRDGVPEELDPLEWEVASDEATTAAHGRQNFTTSVDGGTGNPPDAEEKSEPQKSAYKPLKPIAAAGAVAAANKAEPVQDDTSSDIGDVFETAAPDAELKAATDARDEDQLSSDDEVESEPPEKGDYRPLKPLAAAGVVAAAKRHSDEQGDDEQAGGDETQSQPAITTTTDDKPLKVAAPAAQPESVPPQTRNDKKAAQALNAEVASASIKPLPVDAVESADEDVERWDAMKAGEPDGETESLQPAATNVVNKVEDAARPSEPTSPVTPSSPTPADEPSSPQPAASTSSTPSPSTTVNTTSTPAKADEENQPKVLPARAAAAAVVTARRKRKKRAEAEAQVEPESAPAEAQSTTPPVEAQLAEPLPAPEAVVDEMVEQSEAVPVKPSKAKRARKTAAKPSSREAQTEKVRKTYERAIATVKREDLPKLIAELNKAAENDADNKIIFELLGQAYNRQGNIPAAINAYRRALELAEHA